MTGKPRANSANSIRKNHRAELVKQLRNVPVEWLVNIPEPLLATRWFYACHTHLVEFLNTQKNAFVTGHLGEFARCTMYSGWDRWTRVWSTGPYATQTTYTTKRVNHTAPGIPPGKTVAVWRFHAKPDADLTTTDNQQTTVEAESRPLTQAQRAQIFTAIGGLIGSLLQADPTDLTPPLGIRELLAAISHAAQPDHWLG